MRTRRPIKVTTTLIATVLCALTIAAQVPNHGPNSTTPAGTSISVRAEASYRNEAGELITTVSESTTVTVGTVSGLVVTPDDSAPSSNSTPHERVTSVFSICNAGNISDRFTLKRAEITPPASLVAIYFDLDASGALSPGDTPITIGQTISPSLDADRCLGVLVVTDTNDAPARSLITLRLAAISIADGTRAAEDEGTIIYGVGTGPMFSSPRNSQQPPLMLVEGQERVTATPGQSLTFSISFRNSGDATAENVLLTDDLPPNLEYIPNSLNLGAHALTDADDADGAKVVARHLEVRLKEVAPGDTVDLNFRARLSGQAITGTGTVNTALLSAENLRNPKPTSDAVVVSDPFGIVYAARSGGAVKLSGAKVIISTDQTGANPLALVPNSGIAPNEKNNNPFVTGSGGDFNFALAPSQVGTESQPATYFINVEAAGFRRRVLEASLRAREHDLYRLTVRAIDDQPIAKGGSFTLTREEVQLDDLAVLVLNIPMFETATFELTKVADKQRVDIGDVVSYRVAAHNALASSISEVVVHDRLPASFHYVPGTARIEPGAETSHAVEPELAANEMLFRLGQLGPGERVTVTYRVRVGVNAVAGEQFNTAMAEGAFSSDEKISTAIARAGVVVNRGIFGMQRPMIGRVFADVNSNGEFDEGDRPIQGARLYLSNGDSVVTDSEGMYNFPLVNEGSVTISLDPISISSGYKLLDDRGRAARSWARLLRTPLGGGALLRQNFALLPLEGKPDGDAGTGGRGDAEMRVRGDMLSSVRTAKDISPHQLVSSSPLRPVSASPRPRVPASSRLPVSSSPRLPLSSSPLAAGTYELEARDDVAPVALGEARIDSPVSDTAILSAAMRLEVTVAEGWSVAAELNGVRVPNSLVGEQRTDHKNKLSTYTFIGVNVRPGPNRIMVTAISPEHKEGNSTESIVYGRGPAKRLEVVPDKKELLANGRDRTLVHVRAFDQWNHPAADEQVVLQVSSGLLVSEACGGEDPTGPCSGRANISAEQASIPAGQISDSILRVDPATAIDAALRQQKVSLTGGEARVYLIAAEAPGNAELLAQTGQIEARASVRYLPEMRRAILVGMAEATFGRAAPDREWQGIHGSTSSRLSFFYRGPVFGKNLLTLAYDSHRPFHRTAGRDRVYELDPRDRVYPLFGDSSTRFEEARSNSKLYARLDRGPSFLMFGDFNPDQDGTNLPNPSTTGSNATRVLTGYSRNLTGIKLHLDNGRGDSITVTGARPDTSFARDVFPGGSFGLLYLSQSEILPGSENVVLEV
ncbi:MAG TPA: hypothetical protein VGQ39_14590, partial [Pyrinomonadaceae bacterium]|nr:hypothetical protein [Pyrinomonadaceae bacterium]